jgi:hypothetical protein
MVLSSIGASAIRLLVGRCCHTLFKVRASQPNVSIGNDRKDNVTHLQL